MNDLPSWLNSGRRNILDDNLTADFRPKDDDASFPLYVSATNAGKKVIDMIRPIVMGDECLIVTGYQDLLSALSIIMEVRPGITHAAPGTIRLLFGTNTDNLRYISGPRQSLPEHVERHYMSQTGVFVKDMRDLKAVLARGAIRSGAIRIRVFDEALAEEKLGFYPGMMHAKLFVSEDFAATGSANFSRRGLASNIEFTDRLLNGFDAHAQRQMAGEQFWEWGREWSKESLRILDRLVRRTTPSLAVDRIVDGFRNFGPWLPRAGMDGLTRNEAAVAYDASRTVYEHGFAYVSIPPSLRRVRVGCFVAAVVAEMYERCVLRDDTSIARRHGAVAVVPAGSEEAWEEEGHGSVRIAAISSASDEDIDRQVAAASTFVVEDAHRSFTSRGTPTSARSRFASSAPCWSVSLAASLPGTAHLSAVIDNFVMLGSMTAGDALAGDLAAGLKTKRGRAKSKLSRESLGEIVRREETLLRALGPLLCEVEGTSDDNDRLCMEVIEFPANKAVIDDISSLVAPLQSLWGVIVEDQDDAVADEGRAAIRRLISSIRVPGGAAEKTWHETGASETLRRIESGSSSAQLSDQGLLPIFGDIAPMASTPLCDDFERQVSGRNLKAIDRTRQAQVADLLAAGKRNLFLVHSDVEAAALQEWLRTEMPAAAGSQGGRDGEPRSIVAVLGASALNEAPQVDRVVAFDAPGTVSDAMDVLSVARTAMQPGLVLLQTRDLVLDADPKTYEDTLHRLDVSAGGGSIETEILRGADIYGRLLARPSAQSGSSLRRLVKDLSLIVSDRDEPTESGAQASAWGAEFAVLESDIPFTAFFLAGKTGRRHDDFMPPRLLLVLQGEDRSEEIVRSQCHAIQILLDAARKTFSEGGYSSQASLDQEAGALDDVSRHLASLTHWDLRPERLVAPLAELAEFLASRKLACSGASVLGDLSLPSLELVADHWSARLRGSWVEAKQAKQSDAGRSHDVISAALVTQAMKQRSQSDLRALRAEMKGLIDELRFADRDRSKTVQDRVSVIIKGRASAKTE